MNEGLISGHVSVVRLVLGGVKFFVFFYSLSFSLSFLFSLSPLFSSSIFLLLLLSSLPSSTYRLSLRGAETGLPALVCGGAPLVRELALREANPGICSSAAVALATLAAAAAKPKTVPPVEVVAAVPADAEGETRRCLLGGGSMAPMRRFIEAAAAGGETRLATPPPTALMRLTTAAAFAGLAFAAAGLRLPLRDAFFAVAAAAAAAAASAALEGLPLARTGERAQQSSSESEEAWWWWPRPRDEASETERTPPLAAESVAETSSSLISSSSSSSLSLSESEGKLSKITCFVSLFACGKNSSIWIVTESGEQVQALALAPTDTQALVAKLVDSAQFQPWLKPAWYAPGKLIMNSPGSWVQRTTGIACASSSCGEIISSLWRRNSGHWRKTSGRRPLARRSKRPRWAGGTQYQRLGAPKWR